MKYKYPNFGNNEVFVLSLLPLSRLSAHACGFNMYRITFNIVTTNLTPLNRPEQRACRENLLVHFTDFVSNENQYENNDGNLARQSQGIRRSIITRRIIVNGSMEKSNRQHQQKDHIQHGPYAENLEKQMFTVLLMRSSTATDGVDPRTASINSNLTL